MYNIYATDMIFEQCLPDKKEVNVLIPYAVIHFVLSGEGYINGKRLTGNTAFIAYENTKMHYYPSKNDPWSYIYIRLRGDDLKRAFLDHGFTTDLTTTDFSGTETLFRILAIYHELSSMDNADTGRIIANLAFLLFDKTKGSVKSRSKPQHHAHSIARYIDENYYKSLTVEGLANRFFLNKNYLRTIFVNQIGLSPKQYLQKIRMERGALLLASTTEDVSVIARSVGYSDPLLFSKMFKQYHGMSPLRYRKLNSCDEIKRLSE